MVKDPKAPRTWTVSEAQGRLSEVLRLAEEEGPQLIGVRRSFVVVPAAMWYEKHLLANPWGNGWLRTSRVG